MATALSLPDFSSMFGALAWPFLRIGAAVGIAPIFGARSVPTRVRLMLAFALTAIVAPVLPPPPDIDILGLQGVLVASQELLIGVAMGFSLLVVFAAFVLGGQIAAMQMGLGFASLVDPQNGVQTPMISQFYVLLSTLMFLALDGHLIMIQMVVDSFHSLPVGTSSLGRDGLWQVVIWGREIFAGAVMVALPLIASLMLVNLAFGVLTRAAPQLNIFAVGFPVIIVSGYLVIMLTIWSVAPRVTNLLTRTFDMLRQLTAG